MSDDWQVLYRRLKERDPRIYKKAIEYGEGITIQHNLNSKAAAELEQSFVVFALELTGGLNETAA